MPTFEQCNRCSVGSSDGCEFYNRKEDVCSHYKNPVDNSGMFNRPFAINGRIGRLEMLISYAIYLVSLFGGLYVCQFGSQSGRTYLWVIGLIFLLGGIWFIIAQYVKRAHDCGMETSTALLLGFFVRIVCLVYCFIPGVSGPNQYGSNPNEPYEDQIYKG